MHDIFTYTIIIFPGIFTTNCYNGFKIIGRKGHNVSRS